MADLLTHVLVPFVLLTPLSWRFRWLTDRWIVLAMAGAAIPDLVKVGLVVDGRVIESITGLPFSYAPLATLGGVLAVTAGLAVLFGDVRRRAFGYILLGGLTSLALDGMRVFADGHANFWLYPFVWWRPPTPSLYVTSDPRVTAVALAAAGLVFVLDRSRPTSE